jgi:hemoglobin/transferrin/lactoferrin receptor protein
MYKGKSTVLAATAVLSVAGLATSGIVQADKDNRNAQHSFTLDKVTVAATLTEEKLEDVANTVSVIDAEQIENTVATDIRDLIRYEPGVEVRRADRFGLAGFNVRGFEGNRVKISIDGVDLSRALNTGGPYLRGSRNFVDIDAVKRVEILKGPASSLYGSDALGGVVAFTTKDPADYLDDGDDTTVSVKAAYDSTDNSLSETLTFANRIGAFESLLVYTHREGEEFENFNEGYAGGQGNNRTIPDPVDYDSDNVLVKFQYQLNQAHRLGLTLERFESNTQTELLSLEGISYNPMFNYSDYTGDDTATRERLSLSHQWEAQLRVFDSMSWHIDWQDGKTEQLTRNYTEAFGYGNRLIDYNNQEQSIQLDAQFDKTIGDHELTYGISYQESELENTTDKYYLDDGREPDLNRYTPVIEANTLGVYAQYQLHFLDGRFNVTPSIRYDVFEADPGVDSRVETEYEKHKSEKATARLGFVYKFDDVYSAFAQYSQGFKAPDVEQLYHEDTASFYRGYVILANPDLEPEESNNSYEVGLRANGALGSFEVSAYYNEYKNFIKADTTMGEYRGLDVSIIQYQNLAEATVKGLEARGSIWLDSAMGAPTGTSLSVALAYAQGEGNEKGDPTDRPINTIAPLKAVIGLNYDASSNLWGGSLVCTLVEQKKPEDIFDETDFSSPGYGLLDLTAYYQPVEPLVLRVGVYNLTDKEYWQWGDVNGLDNETDYLDRFTQPGRNASLSVKYSF